MNFIGGYSALVNKGMTKADRYLMESIPEALSVTDRVCSSINVGSTKTGINMDAVKMLGEIILETSRKTADKTVLVMPSLLYLLTHRMTTHLWQVLSMVLQKQTRLLMSVSVDRGVVKRALENVRGKILKNFVRQLKRQI